MENPLRITVMRRGSWLVVISQSELDRGADDRFLDRVGRMLALLDLPAE